MHHFLLYQNKYNITSGLDLNTSLENDTYDEWIPITHHSIDSFDFFEGNLITLDHSYSVHVENYSMMFIHEGISATLKTQMTYGDLPEIPLDTVVADIFDRYGISSSKYDVTDLSDDYLTGYTLQGVLSGKGALQPLITSYLFDVIEADWKIVCKKRGSASIQTIAIDDLACHEDGQEYPDPIVQTRTPELELPKEIAVRYSNPERDSRKHTITTVFIAEAKGEPVAADDAQEIGVFHKDKIPQLLAFDHSDILRDYFIK